MSYSFYNLPTIPVGDILVTVWKGSASVVYGLAAFPLAAKKMAPILLFTGFV